MAAGQLLDELKKRYGAKNGTKIYMTIVPGILADFKKVLGRSDAGEMVTETYHFEDGDGGVVVTGSKDTAGQMQIEAHLKE